MRKLVLGSSVLPCSAGSLRWSWMWLALGLGLVACDSGRRSGEVSVNLNQRVILISIDTLRADRLGCYGYAKATSRSIDRFAQEAILFRDAVSHAPSTLPSHASIFTSMLPSRHGASHRYERALPDEAVTLAEVFRKAGFATGSFNGGGQVAAEYGLAQGFSVYESEARASDRFETTARKALEWIDALPEESFFLFLHTFEVHQPFGADRRHVEALWDGPDLGDPMKLLRAIRLGHTPLTSQHEDYLSAHYDAEVRSMDEGFAVLLDGLSSRDLYDSTMIVLTSDHGEELGERGAMCAHAHTLHRELLHVPLLLKLAGRRGTAGREVTGLVRGIDLGPTILAAVGLPAPSTFTGENLLGRDAWDGLAGVSYQDTATDVPLLSVTTNRWKIMGPRLFDRRRDQSEWVDVSADNPAVFQRLESLRAASARELSLAVEEARPTEETLRQLRALGYLD